MGTNFAFVLYQCPVGEAYRVKVLQNEKETIVNGCDSVYCPLQQFLQAYQFYLTSDFDQVCQNDKSLKSSKLRTPKIQH